MKKKKLPLGLDSCHQPNGFKSWHMDKKILHY